MELALTFDPAGFCLDLAAAGLAAADLDSLSENLQSAHAAMVAIEAGAIANIDEHRQVTHFTDRTTYADSEPFDSVESFFVAVAAGEVLGSTGKSFQAVILNGIGGSALGPQLAQLALRGPYWNEWSPDQRGGRPRIYFADNTDAAGLTDILNVVDLEQTLTVSISKSGGTRETYNNMAALQRCYAAKGLDFGRHAAAVTMSGSKLDDLARANDWLQIWPMPESIGGRTSETAIVGHVAAAAAGIDFRALINGAIAMDDLTRNPVVAENPAYMLAAAWYCLGNGCGDRNMVVIPYSDRLSLLSRYLQQLVMESLGKEFDRDGNVVHQGLSVFGNKGGTDAHAYVQQLQDGSDDFFVTFIEVLKDAAEYDTGDFMMGDYLHNFLQGLSDALAAKGRPVIRITIDDLSPYSLGMLIALYERAVAAYAELVNINAFHQPGVQAYKEMSKGIDAIMQDILNNFNAGEFSGTADTLAATLGRTDAVAAVDGILSKWAVNGRTFVNRQLNRELRAGRWWYTLSTVA
jgi:glucose-6-phosphate isomerase